METIPRRRRREDFAAKRLGGRSALRPYAPAFPRRELRDIPAAISSSISRGLRLSLPFPWLSAASGPATQFRSQKTPLGSRLSRTGAPCRRRRACRVRGLLRRQWGKGAGRRAPGRPRIPRARSRPIDLPAVLPDSPGSGRVDRVPEEQLADGGNAQGCGGCGEARWLSCGLWGFGGSAALPKEMRPFY